MITTHWGVISISYQGKRKAPEGLSLFLCIWAIMLVLLFSLAYVTADWLASDPQKVEQPSSQIQDNTINWQPLGSEPRGEAGPAGPSR